MAVRRKRRGKPRRAAGLSRVPPRGTRDPALGIRFGTDGWRGVIADDFTFENATLVARALARYLVDTEDLRRGVVVGYDTRFLAERFARRVAEVLTSVGADVRLAAAPTPTPALSYAVRATGAAAGVMLTASHNPPEWLGLKLKARFGGSALPETVKPIERLLAEPARLPRVEPNARRLEVVDFKPAYLARLGELVDLGRLAGAGLRLAHDAMHGAGAGYLRELLAAHGSEITEIRGARDPLFGGTQPEPVEASLEPLRAAVLNEGCDAGFATDGDADRVAALDAAGRFVDPHKIFALVLRHLVERKGLRGGVAKTFSVSKMIDRMAEGYGLELFETPIGFKHIAALMLERDLVAGGEESGGIGVRPHLPERDALLISLLLAEVLATEGKPLADCVADLQREFGPLYYRRVDLHLDPPQKQRALGRVAGDNLRSPAAVGKLGEWTVVGREELDGTKLYLLNAGWVLIRASGTEPVVRLYAEAHEPALADRVVAAVEELVRTA